MGKDLGIFDVAKHMFSALRNQAMFKQVDLIAALDERDLTRFLIEPTRTESGEKSDFPLACGALAGFSGFIDR